jgi:hypothetical protein
MVNRGWYGRQSTNRRGRNQRAVWRALVGYSQGRPMTTAELLQFIYPRLRKADRRHYWYAVRCAAERYAVRAEPRTRPLRWVARADLYD